MTHRVLFLALSALVTVAAPAPPGQDTLDITREVRDSIHYYKYEGARPLPGRDAACNADRGEWCSGGDPDVRPCPSDTPCPRPTMESMLEWLRASALAHPEAGFVVGYTAYTFTRFGREDEALDVARACRATRWWCAFVEGHARHARGELNLAEELFREGLGEAPDSIHRVFTDVDWIVERDVRQHVDRLSGEERASAIERVWWLTDPLFALEGNDRWTEHVNRVHTARLYLISGGIVVGDLHRRMRTMRKSLRDLYWGWRVPRGVWDSWTKLAEPRPDGVGFNFFTGRNAARYHFVPDFEDGDLERPVWRLEAEFDDEGYTPPYGTFHELPSQIARFRNTDAETEGDSMRVAAAGTLTGTEMAGTIGTEPHLVFSDAPESFPVHHTSELVGDRSAFLVDIPAERYVLSHEVLGDGRFGRHRQMLEPLRTDGIGVSDVLLYRPNGEEPPESLEAAAELMLAETAIRPGEELGVYWETYGVEEGMPVEIEVAIEGESGGFFSRLRGLFPGGSDHTPVRLGWSEASPGPHFPRGVVLEPGNLEEGSYTLVIRAAWEGREPFEIRRAFEVR